MTLNPFKIIKNHFDKKKSKRIKQLELLGFNNIRFPILIVDGNNLDLVYSLQDFAIDPDLYFHEFDQTTKLIDSNGEQWSWYYNASKRVNTPENKKRTLSLAEVKSIIHKYFQNSRIENQIKLLMEDTTTTAEFLDKVADKF